jgi:hypothetical protein
MILLGVTDRLHVEVLCKHRLNIQKFIYSIKPADWYMQVLSFDLETQK